MKYAGSQIRSIMADGSVYVYRGNAYTVSVDSDSKEITIYLNGQLKPYTWYSFDEVVQVTQDKYSTEEL